jgi:hypothetical protein
MVLLYFCLRELAIGIWLYYWFFWWPFILQFYWILFLILIVFWWSLSCVCTQDYVISEWWWLYLFFAVLSSSGFGIGVILATCIYLAWFLWLWLTILCWVVLVEIGIFVLFQVWGRKLCPFPLSVWCLMLAYFKLPLLYWGMFLYN